MVEYSSVQILGIRFFAGEVDEAVALMFERGGYLVAPSGTCFDRLDRDQAYRDAVTNADLALPDSGGMVMLWRLLRGTKLTRISGWRYVRSLSARIFAGKPSVLWVLPNEIARNKTERWLRANGFPFLPQQFYVAPIYGRPVTDPDLVSRLEQHKPAHVVIGIGSGPQEKLGHFLRENLSYRPAVHCVGAALGFVTGDQVALPAWADRFYLGWLFRLFAQPRIFLPRLARGLSLPWLILRYGADMPPLKGS